MPAHVHAELMAQYAKDALETDKPWERWEFFDTVEGRWENVLSRGPLWNPPVKYRRKRISREVWINVYPNGSRYVYDDPIEAAHGITHDGTTVHFREVIDDEG